MRPNSIISFLGRKAESIHIETLSALAGSAIKRKEPMSEGNLGCLVNNNNSLPGGGKMSTDLADG